MLSKLTESQCLDEYGYSETHCIDFIGRLELPNVTKVAEQMQMTRGAISKMTKKLLAKGLIEKYTLETNRKEVYFRLTDQGKLLFEDKAVSFPLLADGLLTPAAAPWIFVRTLRSGNLIASGREGDGTRLSIDDSFREDALRLDIWLDEAGNPAKADISCKEQRYLSMVVQNFRTESEPEA